MRAKWILFALSVSAVLGQDISRVFHLHHIDKEQDIQEFATTVRTLSDLPPVTVDPVQKTISATGSATQIAIAEWLLTELDRQNLPDFASKEFKVPNKEDDVARIFFVRNTATVQEFQQVAATVRTIAEFRRLFTFNTPRALAVRGTPDQIATAEWMIRELDQPGDAKRANSRQYQMIDPTKEGFTAVRVFYLPYASTEQQLLDVATLVRLIGEIGWTFPYDTPRALTVRGTPDQVALADWMIHELGKPVSAEASTTYTYRDVNHDGQNLVRVFYLKDSATIAALQQVATQIRTTLKIRRVFTYNETRAIVIRGTETQLAAAEQMLNDRARQIAVKQ